MSDFYTKVLTSRYLHGKIISPLRRAFFRAFADTHTFPSVLREVLTGAMLQILSGGAEMRVKVTLACTECKQRNYDTKKNKKNDPDRLEMNKYCRFCRKHTLHRETK